MGADAGDLFGGWSNRAETPRLSCGIRFGDCLDGLRATITDKGESEFEPASSSGRPLFEGL